MFKGSLRVGWSRFGRFGGAMLAVTSVVAGCGDDGVAGSGDVGLDAAVGTAAANPRGDGGLGTGLGTQDFTVELGTGETVDHISVGLDSLAADAGALASSSAQTSESPQPTTDSESSKPVPTSTAATSSTPDAPSSDSPSSDSPSSEPSSDSPSSDLPSSTLPVESTGLTAGSSGQTSESSPSPSSEPPADTSLPPADTSAPPVDTETSAPLGSSSEPASSSAAETSGPLPPIEVGLAADASWVDLPATFSAVGLPDLDLSFAWSVVSVPNGSNITTEGLVGNASSVTFEPDVAGAYTLNLHVASGGASGDVEATVNVAKVDVGLLKVTDGGDGYYVSEPMMIPSDQSTQAFNVGCAFHSGDFDDNTNWIEALRSETSAIGFRYPRVPEDGTLFAYHYHYPTPPENGPYPEIPSATHVATATSNCTDQRPVDLQQGFYPDFSPSAQRVARVDMSYDGDLVASSIDANDVVYPYASSPVAVDWADDEGAIAWAGRFYAGGEYALGVVSSENVVDGGSTTLLECRDSSGYLWTFESIDKFSVVPGDTGGLLVLSNGTLWFLPWVEGTRTANCYTEESQNFVVASSVDDFELAQDGQTIGLITRTYYGDTPVSALAVGPANTTLDVGNSAWQLTVLDTLDGYTPEYGYGYYDEYGEVFTGLHWIGGSKQLVWTRVQYQQWSSDGYYFTDILGASVQKINADGTHRRTLAAEESAYGINNLMTTGYLAFMIGNQGG